MTWEVNLTTIVAFIIGVIAVGRFTRLVVDDDFPPVAKIRDWYIVKTGDGPWSDLVQCPFCFATWPAIANLLLAWASDLAWWWWIPNLWFAGSYMAAMLNNRDIRQECCEEE